MTDTELLNRLSQPLGADAARELAEVAELRQKEQGWSLRVNTGRSDWVPPLGAALQALAQSDTPVVELEVFHLADASRQRGPFANAHLEELLAAPASAQLAQLTLTDSRLDAAGAEALASAELGALRGLSLAGSAFGAQGVVALCAGPGLARLERLNLYNVPLGRAGAEALARAPFVRTIKLLDLFFTRVGPEGARALAEGGPYPKLEALLLWASEVGDAGAAALAGSRAFPKLKNLDLGRNELTDQALAALARATAFPHCKRMRLADNAFGNKGAAALAASEAWPELRELDVIQARGLDAQGLEELFFSKALAKLKVVRRDQPTPSDWPERSGRKVTT